MELAQGLGLQAVNHEYAALEITLPASGAARTAAPLAVYTHADVPRVAEHKWETPPFELKEVDGVLRGLGVYDDKGPLIVNLFALRVLRDAGLALQRPVVLVVDSGAEELGSSAEAALARLATRPALALAADGDFPYTTTEPGRLVARITSVRGMKSKAALEEGQFYVHRIQVMENTNTLPAQVRSWVLYKSPPVENPALEMSTRFRAAIEAFQPLHPETRYEIVIQGDTLHFFTYGRPAHTQRHEQGVHGLLNTAGALLTLDLMPNSARDLLLWVDRGYRRDPSGASLGLVPEGSETAGTWVNPMRLERLSDEITVLVDIRWAPGRDAAWMQQRLAASIEAFNAEHGTDLKLDWEPGGYEPVQVSLPREIRRALEEAYGLASGESEPPPAVTTSSTRLLPAAIPFGPAWPGREPRGHTLHEALPRRELQDLGVAYVSALAWLAAGPLPATP
jgi:acetylornithine deacetylase/succinyl-diaminopimelate desuccinylase-like protein